jgi:hypothetical protein
MPTPTPRPPGPAPYRRLDLTGVTLPPLAAAGVEGRAAMLRTAADLGYPHRTVTPALTRFSRVYVIQLGGDPDAGTVTLVTRDRRQVTVRLDRAARHRIPPPTKVEAMLAAVEADYPPTSLTAALAEALAAVLHACDRHTSLGQASIRIRDVTEVLAAPLRAFLDPWTDEPDDEPDRAPTPHHS